MSKFFLKEELDLKKYFEKLDLPNESTSFVLHDFIAVGKCYFVCLLHPTIYNLGVKFCRVVVFKICFGQCYLHSVIKLEDIKKRINSLIDLRWYSSKFVKLEVVNKTKFLITSGGKLFWIIKINQKLGDWLVVENNCELVISNKFKVRNHYYICGGTYSMKGDNVGIKFYTNDSDTEDSDYIYDDILVVYNGEKNEWVAEILSPPGFGWIEYLPLSDKFLISEWSKNIRANHGCIWDYKNKKNKKNKKTSTEKLFRRYKKKLFTNLITGFLVQYDINRIFLVGTIFEKKLGIETLLPVLGEVLGKNNRKHFFFSVSLKNWEKKKIIVSIPKNENPILVVNSKLMLFSKMNLLESLTICDINLCQNKILVLPEKLDFGKNVMKCKIFSNGLLVLGCRSGSMKDLHFYDISRIIKGNSLQSEICKMRLLRKFIDCKIFVK